jgi:protein involved in polysaccharide export with SLBB domain
VINLEKLLADETDLWSLKAGDLVYVPEGAMVYVSGQVTKPGPVLFTDGITLTQALNAAGGPLPTARLRTAFILRDGVRTVVKLKRILRGQELDITLRPGDQIFLEQAVF